MGIKRHIMKHPLIVNMNQDEEETLNQPSSVLKDLTSKEKLIRPNGNLVIGRLKMDTT